MSHHRKFIVLAAVLTMAVVGTGVAIASDLDNIVPASTSFTATSSNSKFTTGSGGTGASVSCPTSTITGTTPESGLGPINITAAFDGTCTSSLGGTVTVTVSNPWTLTYTDDPSSGDEQLGPNDDIEVGVNDGAGKGYAAQITVVNGVFNCTIDITGGQTVSTGAGGYNDSTGVATFTNAPVKWTATGNACPGNSGTGSFSGTYTTSPKITDS